MAYIGSPFTFDSRIPDPGATDQVLKSDGAGNWTTADPAHLELPVPGAAGKVLTSDGTNWTSTKVSDALTTDLTPGVAGKVLASDGTSWISGDAPDELPAPSTAGKLLTSDGTNWTSATAPVELPTPGVAGYVLKSDGSNWISDAETDPGLPVAGTAGKLLTSDGTNWISSTPPEELPVAGTAGKILTSDGTNWTSATPAPTSGRFEAVADGALANGDRVVLQADGKVKVVGLGGGGGLSTITSDAQETSIGHRAHESGPMIEYDPNDATKFAILYINTTFVNPGPFLSMVIGTISGTTITLGTEVRFTPPGHAGGVEIRCWPAFQWHPRQANLIIVTYAHTNGGPADQGWRIAAGTVSGTTISFTVDDQVLSSLNSLSYGRLSLCCKVSTTDSNLPALTYSACLMSHDGMGGGGALMQVAGWIDPSVLSATHGTPISVHSSQWNSNYDAQYQPWMRFDPNDEQKVALFCEDPTSSPALKPIVKIQTITNNMGTPTITQGTAQVVDSNASGRNKQIEWRTDIADSFILSWTSYFSPPGQLLPCFIVGTVSGTSVTFGARYQIVSTYDMQRWDLLISSNVPYNSGTGGTTFYGVGEGDMSSGSGKMYGKVFTISNNMGSLDIAAGNQTTLWNTIYSVGTVNPWDSDKGSNFQSATNGIQILTRSALGSASTDHTRFSTGDIASAGSPNLTAKNFIGISDGIYADAATATIQIAGVIDDAQSGLTVGSTYYVQSDGTLATTPDTISVLAGTAISATKLLIADSDSRHVGINVLPTPGASTRVLTSDGTNWVSSPAPTELPAVGTSGNLLTSDGTNWNSTAAPTELPVAGTAGKLLTSDGTNWVSSDHALPDPSGKFDAVASGALADGDKVVLLADGKVQKAIPQGALGVGTDAQGTVLQGVNGDIRNDRWGSTIDFDPNDDNKFVVGYWDSSGATGTYLQMVVGTLTGTTISWGTPVDIETAAPQGGSMISFKFHPTQANLIGAVYGTDGTGASQTNGAHFGVATVTGTSLSWTPLLDFEAGQDCSGGAQQGAEDATFSFDWDSQFTGTGFRCAWQNEFSVGVGTGEKLHNAGSAIISPVGAGPHTLTASTTAYRLDNRTYTGGVVRIRSCRFDPFTEGKFFATFANHNGGEPRMVIIELATNATTMTKGSAIQIHFGQGSTEGSENDHYMEWNPNRQNQLLFSFRRKNANYTETPELVLGTVSGTSVTFGSLFVLDPGQGWNYGGASPVQIFWDPNNADKFFGTWSPGSSASYYSQTINAQRFLLTGSGTTITADGTPTEMTPGPENGHTWNSNSGYEKFAAALNASGTKLMVNHMFDGDGSSTGGYVAGSGKTKFTTGAVNIAGTPNLTTTNYIGISDGAYADAATATIQTGGAIDDAQSGLTPGSVYYLQSDENGTLSTTADTPSVIAGTAIAATKLLIADGVGTSAGGGSSGAVESLSSLVEKYPTGSSYPLPAQTIAVGTDKLLLSETFLQTGELTVNGVLRLGKLFEEETPTGVTLITGGFNVVGSGTLTNAQPLVSNYDENFLDNKTGDLDLGVNITNRATGVLGAGVDLSATTGTLTSSHVIGTDVTGVLGSGLTGQPTIAGTNFTGTINTAVQDNITRVGAVVAGSIGSAVTGGGGLTDGSSLTSLDSISKGAIESGGTSAHGVNPVYPAYLSTSTTGAAKAAEDASGTRVPVGLGWDYLGLVRYEGGWMYGTNDSPHLLKVPLSYGLATSSKHRYSQFMIKVPGISCYALNDRLGMQMWIQQMNTASTTSTLNPSIVFNAAAKAGAKHAYCATTLKTDGTSTIMSSQNGDIVPVQAFTAGSGQGSSVFDHYKTQITIFIDNAQVGGGRCRQPPRFHWIACSNYGADPYYSSPNYVTENLYGQYTTGMCTLATTDGQYNHGADMWKQAYNYQFAAIEFRGLSAPNNSGSAILQQGLQTRFKHAQFPLSDMTVHGPGYQSFVHTHSNPMGGMGDDTIGEGAYLYGLRNGIAENTSSPEYTHYGVGYGFDGA